MLFVANSIISSTVVELFQKLSFLARCEARALRMQISVRIEGEKGPKDFKELTLGLEIYN